MSGPAKWVLIEKIFWLGLMAQQHIEIERWGLLRKPEREEESKESLICSDTSTFHFIFFSELLKNISYLYASIDIKVSLTTLKNKGSGTLGRSYTNYVVMHLLKCNPMQKWYSKYTHVENAVEWHGEGRQPVTPHCINLIIAFFSSTWFLLLFYS